jgi:hypothetical protein
MWRCACDCGAETVVDGGNLISGGCASCGCLKRELMAKSFVRHGHARVGKASPEYKSWAAMMARVSATKGRRWIDYAARGITACERWSVFENFLADMGPRPHGRSLDRIDNDGNYEPTNCRWATASEQVRNRRPSERVKREREELEKQ